MMEITFSSHLNNTSHKCKLRKLFPSVVRYIDNFKREAAAKYGRDATNRWAIFLQKTEAEIFIDYIYTHLKKMGIWCLTRHDSILVKHREAMWVYEYMYEYFDRIGLRGILKID